MTHAEIIHEVLGGTALVDSDSEDEAHVEVQSSVSHAQASYAFNTALRWLESQCNVDPVHLLLVKKWRDTAAQKRGENLKQSNLLSYFKSNPV